VLKILFFGFPPMTLLFTRGLNPPQTLPDPVTPGETTFALPNADLFFSLGELLFIAEADATNAEYLGSVSGIDSASITFTLPAQTARPAGASLFSPIDTIRTPGRLDPPIQQRLITGIHSQRTLGGQVVSIRTAEPASELELTITGLTPTEEQHLIDELNAATDHLRLPFTLITGNRLIVAIQLRDPRLHRTASTGGRRSVTLHAFELGENRLV
jgi:hypothetical protein